MRALVTGLALAAMTASATAAQQPKPTVGKRPPRGAIRLFDGKDISAWRHRSGAVPIRWKVENGELEVVPGTGDILTVQEFQDYTLHLEFKLPLLPPEVKSQARANSGVYNIGRYEIQILDSYNNDTYRAGGVGAVYGQKDPDHKAVIPPGQWNTYDIAFRAPRLDSAGKLLERARVTVFHNGILIHDNYEIQDTNTTAGLTGPMVTKGPILLQDHGNRIRFRNIWLLPAGASMPGDREPAEFTVWD